MAQSNEITTEQMNIALARFMGMEGTDEFIRQNYQYHKSWDMLMPIWDRLRTAVSDEFDEDFPAEFCTMCDIWSLHCEHVNINGAHQLLYDAIQWLNQQKQNNESGFDYKSRDWEKEQIQPASEEAINRMKERWASEGKRECPDCGLWFKSEGRCPECNQMG